MLVTRKMCYALILTYYYTFVMMYSWILGYMDVIGSGIAITAVTYLWLIRSISKLGVLKTFEYRDLTFAIAVYSFITFYIAGMALFLSGGPVDFTHALLMITPITVWTFIWTDFYLQKLKGEPKENPSRAKGTP